MGVDYALLGEFCKKMEAKFDHKLVLCKEDPIIPFLVPDFKAFTEGLVLLEGNPTSETLAVHIYFELVEFIQNLVNTTWKGELRMKAISVTIKETCTTSCTFTNN